MSSHRIASRYAKSLIQLAGEQGKLNDVFADMKSIDGIFENSRDLKLMFKSPIIPADKKLLIVSKLFEGKISDLLFRFLTLMIKKGREVHFHSMVESFILQYNEIKNITPVIITSAVKLDATLVQGILNALKTNEKLGEIELKEVIDESIIGGFILTYGDKMLDNSVIRNLSGFRGIVDDDSYIKKYS
ncbi:MAG TPA: ATP synthase F1 subunit delta [Chitinophagales bacterium]|nr:ATP synthase F1 subunit delta [Chitinophagales bacterium]